MIRQGKNLFQHYKEMQRLLWPHHDHHRWSDLCLEKILENSVTVLMGPASSGKTHYAALYALCDMWAWPECTGILVSSTDMRGLKMRIWAEIAKYYNEAKEVYPDLPGKYFPSVPAISMDEVEEGQMRDLRNGVIGVPCKSGQTWLGLGSYVGFKNKRVRLLADECSLMAHSFLDSLSNLMANPGFKGVFMGNPHESIDPLGRAGEPDEGWTSQQEPEKTTTWKTRFMNGVCVNLVGTDSPNFDYPQDRSPKYPYLIHKATIESTEKFYGKDSMQYYSMCKGVMKVGLQGHRVITRELCSQNKAMEQAIWKDGERTRVYGVDVAYGGVGGDRCVGVMLEFGLDLEGRQIVQMTQPDMIPVSIREEKIPEDQIADWIQRRLKNLNIPVKNCFYDSTGRGSIGSSFAKAFGHEIPVPIEFGGRPTMRPVRMDLYIYDERDRVRRLKRCDEHYSKFVTELWYSVRYAIEAGQFRGMTDDVIYEGCIREWMTVAGNKIEVESKTDTKERMGRSPDLFDALVIAFEGARQRGFGISRLGSEVFTENSVRSSLDELARKWHKTERAKRLVYA